MSYSARNKTRRTIVAYAFLAPTLIILGLFHFGPMLYAFGLSLWNYSPMAPAKTSFAGLGNFIRLWSDAAFWQASINSALYLLVVPVIIALSLGLAMLVEPKIPGVGFFRAAYYMPVVTMMVVVALAWKFIFDTDRGLMNGALQGMGLVSANLPWLTDTSWALWTVMSVTVWKGLGYYMVLFLVALKAVPQELKEAATIDGANPLQVFRHVTLPNLWPTISLTAILSSIAALQVFEEIYVMTSGRIGTATLVYRIYQVGVPGYGGATEMGYACAMGVVLFAALFAFTTASVRMLERAYTT
jgi:putative chitobiose transport system permease protein